MSQITRCPACETMFKVVPDQLRISDGWVRCGQCDEVFDASAHLVDIVADDAALAPQADIGLGGQEGLPESVAAGESPGPFMAVDVGSAAVEPVLEEFRGLDEAADALSPSLAGSADGVQASAMPDMARMQADSPEVSFMRGSAAPGAFWRRPLVRATLWLFAPVLCLGLAVQVIVQERDRIAAMEPGLKPLVEAVCVVLQCAIAPLRQIDAVVIESSSFNKIRGDVYRLNFTLKNTAPIHLAVPAIELAVTDLQDQPLMRRVFMSEEFGIRSAVLQGASESSGSITLNIKTNGHADRIAGYRLLAFYP